MGLFSSEELKKWVQNHKDVILNCETVGGLLSLLIEVIRDFFQITKELRKLDIGNLNYISQLWIGGISYSQILESCTKRSS